MHFKFSGLKRCVNDGKPAKKGKGSDFRDFEHEKDEYTPETHIPFQSIECVLFISGVKCVFWQPVIRLWGFEAGRPPLSDRQSSETPCRSEICSCMRHLRNHFSEACPKMQSSMFFIPLSLEWCYFREIGFTKSGSEKNRTETSAIQVIGL